MKCISAIAAMIFLAAVSVAQDRDKLERIQQSLKDDVPRIMCIDERVATGGQPTEGAYAKLASNGYRAVLNLRTAQEGVDLEREKQLVEKAGMRYINIRSSGALQNPSRRTSSSTPRRSLQTNRCSFTAAARIASALSG